MMSQVGISAPVSCQRRHFPSDGWFPPLPLDMIRLVALALAENLAGQSR